MQYRPAETPRASLLPVPLKFREYQLREAWLAFGAEGRAEERIGAPATDHTSCVGWLASEHVMRLIPAPGVGPGALFLAFSVWQTQIQVKACSTGSVIDEVSPDELGEVVLPPLDSQRGDRAEEAWRDLDLANQLERQAIDAMEDLLTR